LVLVAVAALAMVPVASATTVTFDLTGNNLGIPGSVGTVTITDTAANTVSVTVTMNAGFSIQLKGDTVIAFNGPSGLTLGSASGLMADGNAGTFTKFSTGKNVSQFGTFAFDFGGVTGLPKGTVSANTLTFTLTATGLSASSFTGVVIHFCTASGSNCGPQTGFASIAPPTIPEPGTLGLLGTGLVGIAGLVRRRFVS